MSQVGTLRRIAGPLAVATGLRGSRMHDVVRLPRKALAIARCRDHASAVVLRAENVYFDHFAGAFHFFNKHD